MKIPAPKPLQKYLKAENWHLRDANWSPDFIESAQKAEWFYHQERGPIDKFDGVIAITPEVLKRIITITGSITIDGIEFAPDNFA